VLFDFPDSKFPQTGYIFSKIIVSNQEFSVIVTQFTDEEIYWETMTNAIINETFTKNETTSGHGLFSESTEPQ
jgi:hypothetical protein